MFGVVVRPEAGFVFPIIYSYDHSLVVWKHENRVFGFVLLLIQKKVGDIYKFLYLVEIKRFKIVKIGIR